MLHLYNLEKVKIKGLKAYKDYCIESDLSTGDKTLSFLYPSKLAKDIKEECYIRNKNHEFVVKEIYEQNDWKNIKAILNVEDLEGQPWEHFETIEKTIEECLTLAVAGTGWTVEVNGITKRRTIRKTNCSSWDIIQQVKKTYLVEIEFDTINKKVIVAEKLGRYKGTYFMDTINLRELAIQSNSYDFYTRIIAIGKDGIKATVENYQYSSKKKTLIWKDERYTDIKSLTEDATAKLNEISKPYRSYAADIIDLASINDKYSILSYSLGDTIYLISKDKGIKEKQRIIKTSEYPDEVYRNTCEIANSILSFADIQKEYQLTSDTVDNITSDDGTISEDAIKVAVEHLTVNKVDIGDFNAVSGRVGELEVSKLDVNTATIKFAEIDEAIIKKANITDLTAGNIKVDILEGGTAILQDILTNFISGDNGQFIHLTGSNVVIDNAVIKDAMIDTISAGKISAGTMSTNKFTIASDSGNLVISDNTIQIKDGTRVRVQIGKDASNDYNMYLWDASGKLMFDATGLKADAIKDKIIRNDMVSDSANISGSKLDIDSVIVEVNTNGTETFKSSKVKMDSTGQTLDVAFTKVSEDAAGALETANLAQSAVTIANEKIETLVKNTTIVKEDGTTVQLKDAYISTEQTVEGMTTTVSNLETTVNGENGLTSKMQIVEQKVTATGITTTISEAINAGTNSITTTQFVMDKTGFTIKNGALTIKNKANSIVLCGDSEGNLQIGGNNADGSLVVRDASNNKIININKYGAEFANGAIKMTETYVIGGTAGGGMVQYGTKQTYNHSGTESVGADGYRYWDTTETNFGWQGADIQTYKINTSGTRFSDEYRTTITDRWFEMHYKEYVGDSLDALKSRYVIFDMANGNGAISGDLSIKKGQKVMSRGLKLQGIPLEANNFRNGCTFDYDTTGNGQVGPLLSFGGLGDAYECQIASHYQYGHKLKTRSLNGDTGSWGPWYEIYNTGYKPFQRYVTPNGFCLRFDDGTQICWYREQISLACIHVHNNIYYNTTSFTFPYPFAETPAVHGIWATSSITWAHPTSGCTASTAEVRIFSSHSGSVSGILGYLAIGKFA